MPPADRLTALRAVKGCGGKSIDTEETGASFRHDTALPWANDCDACARLLVEAVLRQAVEAIPRWSVWTAARYENGMIVEAKDANFSSEPWVMVELAALLGGADG